jgi:hypothetical protein
MKIYEWNIGKLKIETRVKNITLHIYRDTSKIIRDELKGLTVELKIEYQRKQNAARASQSANKDKAAEHNRTYKRITSIDRKTERNIWN